MRRNRLRHFSAIYDGSNPTLGTNAHDTYKHGKIMLKPSSVLFRKVLIIFRVVPAIVDTILVHERFVH